MKILIRLRECVFFFFVFFFFVVVVVVVVVVFFTDSRRYTHRFDCYWRDWASGPQIPSHGRDGDSGVKTGESQCSGKDSR